MNASEPWVRLGLMQGRSRVQRWELMSAQAPMMIMVGASAGCNWVVDETGVAPLHFSLYWDGRALRISRNPGAPTVSVDGETIWYERRPLSSQARIEFGNALILVETSNAAEEKPAAIHLGPPVSAERSASPAGSARKAREEVIEAARESEPPPRSTLPGAAAMQASPKLAVTKAPAPVASDVAPVKSARAPKPTLIGMAYPAELQGVKNPSVAPPPVAAPNGNPKQVAKARVPGASLAEGDQRTMQGYSATPSAPVTVSVGGSNSSVPPARRDTPRPSTSRGVTQAPMRPISDPVPAMPGSSSHVDARAQVPGEALDLSKSATYALHVDEVAPQQALSTLHARPSVTHGEVRPMPSPASSRPRRPFPWHYVFVGVLTVIAYFAWLYLLDHF